MGYRVGYALIERIARDTPRFVTELDSMKFICKDFWMCVFGKQVDNLKTNHQVCIDLLFVLKSISHTGRLCDSRQQIRIFTITC